MFVVYKGKSFAIGEGVDIGYGVEKTTLFLGSDKIVVPRRGVTSLIVSMPFVDEKNLAEIVALDSEFASKKVEGFEALLLLSNGEDMPSLSFFKVACDDKNEFSDEFGIRIEGGVLDGRFAKAVFVISRDHILYYKEVCKDVEDVFNEEKLFIHLSRALNVYTGTGCH